MVEGSDGDVFAHLIDLAEVSEFDNGFIGMHGYCPELEALAL